MHPPTPPATAASTGAGGDYVAAPAPYAPYPTLSPEDVAPPPPPPPYHAAASYAAPPSSGNPYVSGPAAGSVPPPKSAPPKSGPVRLRFGEGFSHLFIYFSRFRGPAPCGVFPADTMDSVKDVLGKMGKRFGEAARKTENITGNFWQHREIRNSGSIFTVDFLHQIVYS